MGQIFGIGCRRGRRVLVGLAPTLVMACRRGCQALLPQVGKRVQVGALWASVRVVVPQGGLHRVGGEQAESGDGCREP